MIPPPHPQLSIKSQQVYTSPTSTYDTFLESLGQDLSNPAYIGLIPGVILTQHPYIGLTMPSQIPTELHTSVISF